MISIDDGPGWRKYTPGDIKRLESLLNKLEPRYASGKHGGLRGPLGTARSARSSAENWSNLSIGIVSR